MKARGGRARTAARKAPAHAKPRLDVVELARKKRHLHLIERLHAGKSLTKAELEELEAYEKPAADTQKSSNIARTPLALARELGCTARTVRNWIGEGMPVRPDRTFDIEEVQRWREERDNRRKDDAGAMLDAKIKQQTLDRMEFEQQKREGLWILREEVKRSAFETARKTRDAILAIPDRICGALAAEKDPEKIHKALTAEITTALENLR